jgi:hypothetical protein
MSEPVRNLLGYQIKPIDPPFAKGYSPGGTNRRNQWGFIFQIFLSSLSIRP